MEGDAQLALSTLVAAAPVLVYLGAIWWLDRYEREPLGWVLLTLLWGGTFGIVIAVALSQAVVDAAGTTDPWFVAVGVAPLVEEPSKGLILLFLLASRHFDNATDGLVYGAASGLGFALVENVLYFQAGYATGGDAVWRELVIYRGAMTAVMHSLAGATFGGLVGRFRYRGGFQQLVVGPLLGWIVASAFHAAFNAAVLATAGTPAAAAVPAALIALGSIAIFAITQGVLLREHRMIERELADEAPLVPPAHAAIIPYLTKRRRAGWWHGRPEDRKAYIRAATLLAFRKHQQRRPRGGTAAIRDDIDRLRGRLRDLTATA